MDFGRPKGGQQIFVFSYDSKYAYFNPNIKLPRHKVGIKERGQVCADGWSPDPPGMRKYFSRLSFSSDIWSSYRNVIEVHYSKFSGHNFHEIEIIFDPDVEGGN